MVVKQMAEPQVKKLGNLPLKRTVFNKQDCNEEMEFFVNWLKKSRKYPMAHALMWGGLLPDQEHVVKAASAVS